MMDELMISTVYEIPPRCEKREIAKEKNILDL